MDFIELYGLKETPKEYHGSQWTLIRMAQIRLFQFQIEVSLIPIDFEGLEITYRVLVLEL